MEAAAVEEAVMEEAVTEEAEVVSGGDGVVAEGGGGEDGQREWMARKRHKPKTHAERLPAVGSDFLFFFHRKRGFGGAPARDAGHPHHPYRAGARVP